VPYDFYDMVNDLEGLEELVDPPARRRGYCAALSAEDGELLLVGFVCFGPGEQVPGFDYADDGSADVGLGLRPDLTGRGLESLLPGLEFARRRFDPASFRRVEVFTRYANGGEHPFLLMTRDA